MTGAAPPIVVFAGPTALRRWLEAQPEDSPGAWVRLAKARSGLD